MDENPAKRKREEVMQDYEASLAKVTESLEAKKGKKDDEPMKSMLLGMAKLIKMNFEKLETLNEIPTLNQKVEKVQDEVKELREKVVRLEFAQVANSVLIHNLPRHFDSKDSEFEHFSKTEYMVTELLSAAKIKGIVKIIEAIRFLPSKNENINETETTKDRPTTVKLTLGDKRQVSTLFSHLKNLKNTPFCKVSVEREIPASLTGRKKELKTAAEAYRTNDNCKYKIIPKGTDLALLVKKPNEKKYSVVDID